MDMELKLKSYWNDVANQNAEALERYFSSNAYIRWHNTNEHFTVQEFVIANCEYPGDWMGEVERIEIIDNTAITATRVWLSDNSCSFHVTSFFEFEDGKITALNEYWGDDGTPPQWRINKNIGKPIK